MLILGRRHARMHSCAYDCGSDRCLHILQGIQKEYNELDTVWFMAGSLFNKYPYDIPTEAFSLELFTQVHALSCRCLPDMHQTWDHVHFAACLACAEYESMHWADSQSKVAVCCRALQQYRAVWCTCKGCPWPSALHWCPSARHCLHTHQPPRYACTQTLAIQGVGLLHPAWP